MTMGLQDYVEVRDARDPGFEAEVRAAEAEMVLGEALARRREEHGLALAQLADTSGIPEARLAAIEAGEAMTLHEVLWLLHALEMSVSIGADFRIMPQALVPAGVRR
jgi:hypothetical protein